MKLELEDVIGRKVDLVEFDTVKPKLKERILNKQVDNNLNLDSADRLEFLTFLTN